MGKAKYLVNYHIFVFLARQLKQFPFDANQIKKNQFQKVSRLLTGAYQNFDMYKDLMNDAKLDPASFKEMSQLEALKPIKKHDYRTFVQEEVKKNPKRYENYCIEQTSGSSGFPLKTYRTWKEKSNYLARFLRPFFVNGYSVFDKTLCIVPKRRLTSSDSIVQKMGLLRRIAMANDLKTEEIIRKYEEINAEVFYANLSNLTQLALHLKEEKQTIKKPKFYFSVAESMDENSKELVTSVFGDNILNHYGSIELGTMAFQQLGNDYLHFTHDTHLMEVLDDNNNSSESGKIIVTDLDVHSFPLIRYDLGDTIETREVNGIKVIDKIIGRSDDLVTLPTGKKRSANIFAGIFAKCPQVRQFKIIQESINDLSIQLVTENAEENEFLEKFVEEKIGEQFGNGFNVNFNFVPYIAQEKNGKLAKFISHLD